MSTSDSTRISPTGHYVSWLKHRGGVCGPELTTSTGRLIHHAIWPLTSISRLLGGMSIQDVIVARHRGVDHLLAQAIEDGSVTQVVELAAGLSPRGQQFIARYADRGLIYVEGDLPGMCEHKRAALGPLARNHHVVELDALLDAGPTSLAGVGERLLDPGAGTVVICEGLTPYLDRETMLTLWRSVARSLTRYPVGRFLSEVYFPSDVADLPLLRVLRGSFATMTRGRIHLAFHDIADVEAELARAGFTTARVHPLGQLVRELGFDGDPNKMPVHLLAAGRG